MHGIILFIAPPHNAHLHWPWLFNLGSYRSKHLRMQNERHHSCVIPHNACWAMGDQWRESALAPLAWHVRSDMICPNVTWLWNETRQASDLTLLRLYLVSCMPDLGLSFLAVRLLDRPFILSDDIPVRSTFTTPQYRLVQNMLFELRIETKLGLHVSHEHQHIRVDIISEIKGGPNAKRAHHKTSQRTGKRKRVLPRSRLSVHAVLEPVSSSPHANPGLSWVSAFGRNISIIIDGGRLPRQVVIDSFWNLFTAIISSVFYR